MEDDGVRPDWIVGTSIGAINGALIAGNPPECRVAQLRTFFTAPRISRSCCRARCKRSNRSAARPAARWQACPDSSRPGRRGRSRSR
ncbi:patatin-like phospholipase family protein [Paraburkholderia elongata]